MAQPDEAQPDDLPRRVGSLEQQVAMIREQMAQSASDAAAARVLAAGADRDVSEVRAELRAHTGVLNALREDQPSLRAEMGDMRTEIDELRQDTCQGFEETRLGFEETRRQFATVHTGLAQIVTLVEGIS